MRHATTYPRMWFVRCCRVARLSSVLAPPPVPAQPPPSPTQPPPALPATPHLSFATAALSSPTGVAAAEATVLFTLGASGRGLSEVDSFLAPSLEAEFEQMRAQLLSDPSIPAT